jgi:hypothetical protein
MRTKLRDDVCFLDGCQHSFSILLILSITNKCLRKDSTV